MSGTWGGEMRFRNYFTLSVVVFLLASIVEFFLRGSQGHPETPEKSPPVQREGRISEELLPERWEWVRVRDCIALSIVLFFIMLISIAFVAFFSTIYTGSLYS
jgi:hypothetical protein